MIMNREIDMSAFPSERKKKLENIYRYHVFNVLFYRSNVWMHTHRVLWLLETLVPLAKKHLDFDPKKASIYALVHDDAEIITGDVQAITKLRMSTREQKNHENKEAEAIERLAKIYPKEIEGYSYRELLIHAMNKDCVEAQLVSYIDKLDGYCESLHEVYAGNICLLRSVVFYANALSLFPEKYPVLRELLASKNSPLTYIRDQISPYEVKAENYAHLNKPHTADSILRNNDFPFYKEWKRIVIEKGNIDWLINQKEFLPTSN
jgi:5'-deoxynucleotidase YfbR-like HD superfamily hydrolase